MIRALSFVFTSYLVLASVSSLAAVDVSKLIKITPESNNTKCVEYYHYKGDLYCSTTAELPPGVDPSLKNDEKWDIVFDDRLWQMAWGKKTPSITTIEYVPKGDDINDWHELVTTQFFPGLQVTPQEYALQFVQNLKNSGFRPFIHFYQKSNDQVIFEFRIDSPENQKQDELQIIRSNANGLYILHYVMKKSDMGEENREKWLQNLKNSKIK